MYNYHSNNHHCKKRAQESLHNLPYPTIKTTFKLGENCIQNFHLGRYSVRYTVGNLVSWRRVSGAVKRDFPTYIHRYTSPNENFEYRYPHFNELLKFHFKLEHYRLYKATCHPTKCDVINNVKQLPAVNRKIYCLKFLTLSNQMLRYKIKCIRICLTFWETVP